MTDIPAGPVADFLDGTNRHDLEAVVAAFAPDATVADDGSTYVGRASIRAWADENQVRPKVVLTPVSFTPTTSGAELRAVASGEFPGSPLEFHLYFGVTAGRIDSLRIRAAS